MQYVDAQTAKNEGLAVVQDDGVVKLNVDSTTQLQAGQPRKSCVPSSPISLIDDLTLAYL